MQFSEPSLFNSCSGVALLEGHAPYQLQHPRSRFGGSEGADRNRKPGIIPSWISTPTDWHDNHLGWAFGILVGDYSYLLL
jgi:hypothetical protein